MTDKNLTEIVCVVDRSGSMGSCWDDAVGGFNSFVKEQKEIGIGECRMTLVIFDTHYEVVYDSAPLEEVKSLSEVCSPRGATALLDAVGTAIATVGNRLRKIEEEKRPGNVLMVILTDGAENASREFSYAKVQEMIKHQTDKYKWQFIFLAQNISAPMAGGAMGMSMGNQAHFVANAGAGGMGMQSAYKVASAVAAGTRSRAARGMQVNCTKPQKDMYALCADSATAQDFAASEEQLDDDIQKHRLEYEEYRKAQSESSKESE